MDTINAFFKLLVWALKDCRHFLLCSFPALIYPACPFGLQGSLFEILIPAYHCRFSRKSKIIEWVPTGPPHNTIHNPNTFGFLANRCPSHPSSFSVLSPSLGHCFMSRGQLATIKWIILLTCTPWMANGEKFDSIHSMTASLPSWNSVHFNAAILTSFYFISFICRSPLALRC